MKISDLIQQLSELDQDMEVFVYGRHREAPVAFVIKTYLCRRHDGYYFQSNESEGVECCVLDT